MVLERPPERHVGLGIRVVVDLDVVLRVRREAVEVRTAGRLLEGKPVGDQRDGLLRLGTAERVEVRRVVLRRPRDEWCLPVTGCGRGERTETGEADCCQQAAGAGQGDCPLPLGGS